MSYHSKKTRCGQTGLCMKRASSNNPRVDTCPVSSKLRDSLKVHLDSWRAHGPHLAISAFPLSSFQKFHFIPIKPHKKNLIFSTLPIILPLTTKSENHSACHSSSYLLQWLSCCIRCARTLSDSKTHFRIYAQEVDGAC